MKSKFGTYVLAIILAAISDSAMAQTGENSSTSGNNLARTSEILPPSPNAAALGQYGGIMPGLVTGAPSYSIDLFELTTTHLKFPISLSYNASGARVNDISQRTGMNWTLNIGGVITRSVYDAADETATRPRIPLPADGWSQEAHDFWGTVNQNESDGNDLQPDRFSYNLGKVQGQFILDTMNKPVLLGNEGVSIEADFSSTTYAFTATTHDGTRYYFGNDAEQSGILNTGSNCSSYRDYSIHPTAWFLKKIKHPNGDSIVLFYSSVHSTYKLSLSQTQTRRRRYPVGVCGGSNAPEPLPFIPASDATCVTIFDSYTKRLDSVVLSNGFKIELTYIPRLDIPTDFLLSKINYYYKGHEAINKKGYQLQYQTVKAAASNAYSEIDTTLQYRYFLTDVSERNDVTGLIGKTHKFSYNDAGSLPARLSYSIDYWFFFNGRSNSNLLYLTDEFKPINSLNNFYALFGAGADRQPDSIYAAKGLLTKITYPTGGHDTIFYGGNLYRDNVGTPTNPVTYTPTLQATHNSDGQPVNLQIYFRPKRSQTVDLEVSANYLGNSYEPILQWITYSLLDSASNSPINDVDGLALNGIKLVSGDHQPAFNTRGVTLNANQAYLMKLRISGADVLGKMFLRYNDWDIIMVDSNFQTGGIRINKVVTYDPVSKNSTTKRIFYAYPDNLTKSSINALDAPTIFTNYMLSVMPLSCNGAYNCPGPLAVSYVVSSSPFSNINQYGNTSVAYPCVVESFGENFENGGIEHRFQLSKDLPPSRLLGNQPMVSPFNNNDWFNGKETYNRKFKRDSNGMLSTVEESTMFYKTNALFSKDIAGYTARQNRMARGFTCDMEEEGVSYVDVLMYFVQRRFNYLDSVSTKFFDQQSPQSISRNTSYRYESRSFQLSQEKTTNSIGSDIYNRITYNTDLTNIQQNQVFSNLRNLGISMPIEALKIERRSDGSQWVLGGTLTTYLSQEGKAFADKVWSLEITDPIPLTSFVPVEINSSGVFKYDARYVPKVQFQMYDLQGNVLQQQLPNQSYRSTIFDYNQGFPIAEIRNATYSDCAYTSFESSGKGNWSFSGISTSDATAPTGKRVYNIAQTGGAIVSGPLSLSKTYRLQYWTKSGSGIILINGSAGTVVVTKGAWQLCEKMLRGVTSITVNGTGIIDELKLIPAEANISTATYDPLLGITTYCDQKNNISYYEYDGLGRPKIIKDNEGKILKVFDYQYSKPITQ